ncbi:Hsp33 family molecular chaperone HslO [Thermodesulfobacteriota bacterium]
MKKTKPYGNTLKEQLIASSRDRLHNFIMRGAIVNATRMINEMRANHDLGILETVVLGRSYIAMALLSANLKGNDRISLQIDCSGPIKGLDVEANAFGETRGYLKQIPIPIARPMDSFDLAPFFGAGLLTITKYLEDAKQPFSGKIAMVYGNIAQDLAYYFLTSDQIPTSFSLSIHFDPEGEVTGAGGLFLQAMPGADPDIISELEDKVNNLPSIGSAMADHADPQKIVFEEFARFSPEILADHRIEFFCRCTEESLRSTLRMLPLHDLEDLSQNGPYPVEIRCHNCNTLYSFTQKDIRMIYQDRLGDAD